MAAAVAALAWGLRTLTGGGALAAWLVGTLVLSGTGWPGAAALLAFFVSSSFVSRFEPADRRLDPKGSRRDAAQVLANGGAAALAALLGPARPELALWLVTGTLAAAAADTWATSLGRRSRTVPRDLLSGRAVPPGTSGGVTVLGSGAALVGAALVAGSGAAAGGQPVLFPIAALVGFLGMALDSALGATPAGPLSLPRLRPAERVAGASMRDPDAPPGRLPMARQRRRQLHRDSRGRRARLGRVGLALSLFLIAVAVVVRRRPGPDGPEYLPLA